MSKKLANKPYSYDGISDERVLSGTKKVLSYFQHFPDVKYFINHMDSEIFLDEDKALVIVIGTGKYIKSAKGKSKKRADLRDFRIEIGISRFGFYVVAEIKDSATAEIKSLDYEMDFEFEHYEQGNYENAQEIFESICKRIEKGIDSVYIQR